MPALWEQDQQDGGQDHDRCHREDQRDQDVGGEPKSAAVVPEPHLLAVVVVAAEGRVGLLTGRGEDMVGVGVPEVEHTQPLPDPSSDVQAEATRTVTWPALATTPAFWTRTENDPDSPARNGGEAGDTATVRSAPEPRTTGTVAETELLLGTTSDSLLTETSVLTAPFDQPAGTVPA
jgi:hypothetical protein